MEYPLYKHIYDSALEVHRLLGGPGLLETVYETALCHELSLRGITSKRQIAIPVTYKNTVVRDPLYLDILVNNQVIIEVKANGTNYPFYEVQLGTYLRLTGVKTGYIINFGKQDIQEGIYRVLNTSLGI